MNFPITIQLETERLSLRQLNPEVYQHLFTKCSDEKICQFLNLKTSEELQLEKEKFSKGLATYHISFCNFQMIEKTTDEIIGACGFHFWKIRHSCAEIGYSITDETKKRKGFMSEAIQPIIGYGFQVLKLNRIEASTSPSNHASITILKKCGFKEEGFMRQNYFKDNKFEDSVMFALLRKN